MEKKKQKRKMTIRDWCVISIGTIIVTACVGYLIFDYVRFKNAERLYEELRESALLQDSANEGISKDEGLEDERKYCNPVYDFAKLKETNEDIYAWINIPGTIVDFPVLQSEIDDFYLEHNLDKSDGRPACIYTNKCNNKEFSDALTIVYGHNLGESVMFGALSLFEDAEFFENHREIIVYTEEKCFKYEIYAAVPFEMIYIPLSYDIHSPYGAEKFLKDIQSHSTDKSAHFSQDVSISLEDKFIVLSTCKTENKNMRYLIVGKLAEELYYIE